MSIATEITRITGLRDRIKAKLKSLGLISYRDPDLEDCTEAIEDINEVTPYMIQSQGAQNVAGYKWAQVDMNYFDVAGSTPSGLVSRVAYLGSEGIQTAAPTHTGGLGNIDTPSGYTGMSVVSLFFDSDVIKDANIKNGVKILGVTGTYDGAPQQKSVTLGDTYISEVVPDTGYETMSRIVFSLDSSVFDPSNIVFGNTILGVYGSAWSFKYRVSTVNSYVFNGNSIEFLNLNIYGGSGYPSSVDRITYITFYKCDTMNAPSSNYYSIMSFTWMKTNVTSQSTSLPHILAVNSNGETIDCVINKTIEQFLTISDGQWTIDIGTEFLTYNPLTNSYSTVNNNAVKFYGSGSASRNYYISAYYV